MHPQLLSITVPSYHGLLYGAQYYRIEGHNYLDVPCTVCWTQHAATLMMPATRACPAGWVTQYTGLLASGHYADAGSLDYACLDGDLEDRPSSAENKASNNFFYTVTVCGSLPCPPYADGKMATCAVCSK
nr:hypothetical protein BaRGS_005741 [Batillaria attramentaria]